MSRAEAQRTQRRLFRQDEEWIGKRESLPIILFILSKFLSCSALHCLRIVHFREDFSVSVSICVNLWPIPVSVAAGRSVLSAPLREKIPAKLCDSDGHQRGEHRAAEPQPNPELPADHAD
jgi:hypothetical protein